MSDFIISLDSPSFSNRAIALRLARGPRVGPRASLENEPGLLLRTEVMPGREVPLLATT